MSDTSLPNTLIGVESKSIHFRDPFDHGIILERPQRQNSTCTAAILQNFHARGSHSLPKPRVESADTLVQPDEKDVAKTPPRRQSTITDFITDPLHNIKSRVTQNADPEDPWADRVLRKSRFSHLTSWISRRFGEKSSDLSDEELARRVEHFLPCRANLPVQVYDFGEGRTNRKLISLGEIEQEMTNKPEWVVVRWIHAPLGIGLHHSSVEDIFLNGIGQALNKSRRESKEPPPRGTPFPTAGRAGWPYLETEIVNLRSFKSLQRMRKAASILNSNSAVQGILRQKIFNGDRNLFLKDDVQWRADHLNLDLSFWETVKSDLPWRLSDGDLNMKSPAAASREANLVLNKQTLQEHPVYQDAYIARESFRVFHRGDGYVLSLSPATGVDYLCQDFPELIRLEDELETKYLCDGKEQQRRMSLPEKETSAVAQVYAEFQNEGVNTWPQKTPEWLMVYLMTEVITTPHSVRSGYGIASILDAYDGLVHQLIERKFEPWQQTKTVTLVRSCLATKDELVALSRIYRNKLNFLYRLLRDCQEMETTTQEQQKEQPTCKTMVESVEFAISLLRNQSEQCDQLVTDLTTSLKDLFQLRSIEQNDRSITADSQSKSLFIFTAVTSIFLPLSFMTSYFSMNVGGLVAVSSKMSQGDFWKLSGPIELAMVAILWLYVYKRRISEVSRPSLIQGDI